MLPNLLGIQHTRTMVQGFLGWKYTDKHTCTYEAAQSFKQLMLHLNIHQKYMLYTFYFFTIDLLIHTMVNHFLTWYFSWQNHRRTEHWKYPYGEHLKNQATAMKVNASTFKEVHTTDPKCTFNSNNIIKKKFEENFKAEILFLNISRFFSSDFYIN